MFEGIVRRWEDAYSMLSISLNEALAYKELGELGRANEELRISAAVVGYLTDPLVAMYRALENRGRMLAVPPAVTALNPSFYRGEFAQQSATWNQMLHRILFGGRLRYLHKLRALEAMVITLADQFRNVSEDLSLRLEIRPLDSWSALDALHYDLNTCLRETIVLLKSFLRVLPEASLEAFGNELETFVSSLRKPVRPRLSRVSA